MKKFSPLLLRWGELTLGLFLLVLGFSLFRENQYPGSLSHLLTLLGLFVLLLAMKCAETSPDHFLHVLVMNHVTNSPKKSLLYAGLFFGITALLLAISVYVRVDRRLVFTRQDYFLSLWASVHLLLAHSFLEKRKQLD
ncbi:hypothetical protein KCG48_05815 [Proteiniclasticum sp. BAD-10]|uniref:Uncharacterized protein n=1 Tax=Proteiniclasticum sediminis TaxID=2804028 RepID=A0A941CQD4_9CLOT|nr:hypothetical protein [Proteiniclasticum sediminis]MBR0575858.1 hypothetical protein [Proteiniclasticum sediminis]